MSAAAMNRTALSVALVLGYLFDLWFRWPWLGAGATGFAMLALVALVALVVVAGLRLEGRNIWVGIFIVWLAALPALRDAPFPLGLDLAALLVLLLLAPEFLAGGPLYVLAPAAYLDALVAVLGSALIRAAAPASELCAAMLARLPARRRAASLLRGMLLATPFLVVFTALLASADVVFGAYVERLARLDVPVDFPELAHHALISLPVGWLLAGWLLHGVTRGLGPWRPTRPAEVSPAVHGPLGEVPAPSRPSDAAVNQVPSAPATADEGSIRVGFTETATVLTTLDVLFGGFVVVQATYLFGGRDTLAVAGLSYSEYARRGFFELLTVAAIALPLVVGLEALTRRATVLQRRAFQALAGAMVGLIVVILGSAMLRMALYEDAYGYTGLRVYSHAFMFWLAALCGVFLIALLAERRQWLVFGSFALALVGVAGVGVLNPDRFIAEQNLYRYENSRPLDATHLTDLSADATPVVLRALDAAAARGDDAARDALGSGLHRQLDALDAWAVTPWPTWSLARAHAWSALDERRAEIEGYPLPGRRPSRGRRPRR